MTSTLSRESSQTPSQRARSFFGRNSVPDAIEPFANGEDAEDKSRPTRWGMGILNDPVTIEVPGNIPLRPFLAETDNGHARFRPPLDWRP